MTVIEVVAVHHRPPSVTLRVALGDGSPGWHVVLHPGDTYTVQPGEAGLDGTATALTKPAREGWDQ